MDEKKITMDSESKIIAACAHLEKEIEAFVDAQRPFTIPIYEGYKAEIGSTHVYFMPVMTKEQAVEILDNIRIACTDKNRRDLDFSSKEIRDACQFAIDYLKNEK